jgi:hypothetical protein
MGKGEDVAVGIYSIAFSSSRITSAEQLPFEYVTASCKADLAICFAFVVTICSFIFSKTKISSVISTPNLF